MKKATKKSGLMRMGEASGAPQRMGFLEAAGIATGIGVAISGVSIAADVLRDKLDIGPKVPDIDLTLKGDRHGNPVVTVRSAAESKKEAEKLKKLKKAVKDAKRDLEDAEGAKEKREAKKALREAEEELEEFLSEGEEDEEDEEEDEEPTGTDA
jgi:hypothetical protein